MSLNTSENNRAPGAITRKKPVWASPWGYAEGWLICLALLITGTALQLTIGGLNANALSWPVNIITGSIFTAVLIFSWYFLRRLPMVNWLARVPAAITSIALLTFLVLIMGFTLQEDAGNPAWVQQLGLSNMTSSWPFLFGMMFFMASLGMATLKRLTPMKGRNIGFFLNHAGLYIAILGGLLGAADLKRVFFDLTEGEVMWGAVDRDGLYYEMPLAVELERFNMEEFNPKVAIIYNETGRIVPESISQMFEMGKGHRGNLYGWDVEILEFHKMSGRIDGRFEPVIDYGAPPAALVRVTDSGGQQLEGWITSGSFMYPHQLLHVDHELAIAMTIPQASHYSSDVVIYTPDGQVRQARVEVNKPVSVNGWKLYQFSYDDRFGKWSSSSTIEAIRDPWLPVVYTGIFMLIAGSLYLMTLGKAPETEPDDTPALHEAGMPSPDKKNNTPLYVAAPGPDAERALKPVRKPQQEPEFEGVV